MVSDQKRVEIVIIEDDASIAAFLCDLLELEGFRVTAFTDGTALEAVIAAAPQLILLDLMLPHADGAEVCRRLRADPRTRSTPVVMMTAAATTPATQRLRECDHNGLLKKPFNIDDVLAVAEHYVHQCLAPPPWDNAALSESTW